MVLVKEPMASVVVNCKAEKWLSKLSASTGSAPKSMPASVMVDSPLTSTGAVGKGVAPVLLGVKENDWISCPPMSLTISLPATSGSSEMVTCEASKVLHPNSINLAWVLSCNSCASTFKSLGSVSVRSKVTVSLPVLLLISSTMLS